MEQVIQLSNYNRQLPSSFLELLGRVLRCNVAKLPSAKVEPGKSVWDSEEFLKTVAGQNNSEDDIALEGMEPVR